MLNSKDPNVEGQTLVVTKRHYPSSLHGAENFSWANIDREKITVPRFESYPGYTTTQPGPELDKAAKKKIYKLATQIRKYAKQTV